MRIRAALLLDMEGEWAYLLSFDHQARRSYSAENEVEYLQGDDVPSVEKRVGRGVGRDCQQELQNEVLGKHLYESALQ